MSDALYENVNHSHWRKASMVLFAVLILIGIFTVRDYGLTWDEGFRFGGGDSALSYYNDLFAGKDPGVRQSSYPSFFDLPLAWAHQQFPDWGTRSQKGHIWSLCFGLLGFLSVWRLTARMGGERAGFWALLFLATLPRYYGHMFFNPKDIPLAGTYAFGVWALVALFSRLPRPQWKWVIWIGAAAGMAMSCRIAGFLILVYFGGFVGLYLLLEYLRRKRDWASLAGDLFYWAVRGLVAGLVGFAILYVFWPSLHSNPVDAASGSVEKVQNYGWDGVVLMDGHFWQATDLPFYYLPYWIIRTTPEHLLLLMLGGIVLGLSHVYVWIRRQCFPYSTIFFSGAILLFSGVFPLLYIIWKDPVLYDGMRHVIFVMPPLVAVAALTFEWCLRCCERKWSRSLGFVLQSAALLAVGLVAVDMWALHPYQYVYFNSVSGGLSGASGRDETDYWGLTHKEAGEWLNQYVEQIEPAGERTFKVHQRYSRWMLEEALDPEHFEMWKPREGADFFVSITRFNLHVSYPEGKLLHIVERQGVPLCYVYLLNPALESMGGYGE
ncbi:glycosyltransferase family 39 protein [Coraliomargarita sp. SDUM461004]|uniref:Glycosyltransferase family 39 protein n=1 Tax=Thalassobacterium sedimentorum TaxID=3041258 RepID=A0ABU1AI39_9BACT|nr:glycosyltransferase family 39 protein [Coraliomargarita sp. SDUM461004]MDQ8193298.1 glycosyltransferase family 39 protein [Coraliomargarita sp. SDUM461004]